MAFTNEYSVYPNDIDGYSTLPLRRNLIDEIRAEDHNRLRDAIVKIEQELGIKPAGTYASVSDRLDMIGDAMSAINAHMADPLDAHDASSISVLDSNDYFYTEDVENVINELSQLLPDKPNYIGAKVEYVPNTGIPNFVDGYGTKFIFNVTDFTGEAEDNEVKRTQMRRVRGIRGIHVFEVSAATNNGVGMLEYTPSNTTLYWRAPGDSSFGPGLDVSGLAEGEWDTIYSSNPTKALRFARTSDTLQSSEAIYEETLEVYGFEAVSGYFTIPGGGMKFTKNITRAATSASGISRNQFVIGGTVFPADHGTLVLQRKRRNDDAFYPIAVLDLESNFTEGDRITGQKVYIPSLEDFDTITLYDRLPMQKEYIWTYKDAMGMNVYDDFDYNYYAYQLAKYIIPVSNSYIVGGDLESPLNITYDEGNLKVSAYRIVHYRISLADTDIDFFNGNPDPEDIYSIQDYFESGHDGDNTVRFSNVYVDPKPVRPGVRNFNITPVSGAATIAKPLSGIYYYNGPSDVFNLEISSDDNLFANTFVKDDILHFWTNVFNFPDGYSFGHWGTTVDLEELRDDPSDGYSLFSNTRLPEMDERAWYLINGTYNSERRLYPAPNMFTNRAYVTARFYDPFGAGDGYDAYGAQFAGIIRDKILVNSYPSRSTDTQEYFTDEDYRIGARQSGDKLGPDYINQLNIDGYENFLFPTESGHFIYEDGTHYGYDGYILSDFNSEVPLDAYDLQCGGRLTTDEIDICGLIYPQANYADGSFLPYQFGEFVDGANIWHASTIPSYDGYYPQNKFYQRLFNLGYPVNSFRLRIVSSGKTPISFDDISYYNDSRFGKIEIKIPGIDKTKSTEWMDITKLYTSGCYEDTDGALYGPPSGSAGDFIVPVTFGYKNNADSGNMIAVRVTYFGETANQRTESKKRIMTMLEVLSPEY